MVGFLRAHAVGVAVLVGTTTALACGACSSTGSTGSISDRTIPSAGPTDTGAAPTRTLAPGGSAHANTGSVAGSGGAATIDDLSVSTKISCTRGTSVSITVAYGTTGAVTVVFVLDGATVKGKPPLDGPFDVMVPCDGAAHTLVLTALDDHGQATVASKAILTDVPPTGD
jgi:hypothetical protein